MTESNNNSQLKNSNEFPTAIALPKTYNGKTVTELFPEFKHNSVLRFSKLFGPGRPTSLPKIWKGVKRRNRKTTIDNQTSLIEEPGEIKPEEAKSSQEHQKPKEPNDSHQPSQLDLDFGLIDNPHPHPHEQQLIKDNNYEKEYIEDELGFKVNYGREARDDECLPDDYYALCKPYAIDSEIKTPTASSKEKRSKVASWRNGPAAYWYDKANVPLDAKDFDYGFKKKIIRPQDDFDTTQETFTLDLDLSETTSHTHTHLLFNTLNWEDNIIYDPHKEKIDFNSERIKYAGWVPTNEHRTLASFQSKVLGRNVNFLQSKVDDDSKYQASKWSSLFPNDNYELLYGNWEKNIIMDPHNMDFMLTPHEYIIDTNDDNLILSVPDEPTNEVKDDNREESQNEGGPTVGRRRKTDLNESRMKISKLNKNKDDQNEERDEQIIQHNHQREPKDFFNISNDDYYNPKVCIEPSQVRTTSSLVLQHSTIAIDLKPKFFPTHLSKYILRHFHRLPMKIYQSGELSDLNTHHPVISLSTRIKEKATQREQERIASGGGDFFCMRNAADLSGMDDDLILAEYSEQFPPLMMQIGMATKIKNYYKRKAKDDQAPSHEYGENAHTHHSPFLGTLTAGESLQTFENYMFRAPIYLHKMPKTDYLVIRTRHGYFIRQIRDIFVVGQECPLIEVPGPSSKRANNFIKDFLQVVMFRLFHKSQDNPKRIRMDDIRRAFPLLLENSIRKRLKVVADFRKGIGPSSDCWILRENIRMPSEEDLKQLVSPEACCAYYSMLATEQRLKDAGYGEKNLFLDENEDVDSMKLDDEIKNAPWHTTRAYIDASKGKCLLQVNGPADPTGRGEGFSYVRQAIKNSDKETKKEKAEKAEKEKEKEQQAEEEAAKQDKAQAKKMVTGTDADLRRLHLKDAKKLLLEHGLPEDEIKKLKRWEIIDLVRTMSTKKAKEGQSSMAKFARGTKPTQSDAHEKYKEECQRIFETQNRNLASEEVFSSDEDDDSNEDTDVDEMGKNLESLLQTKKVGSHDSNPQQNQQHNELKKLLFDQNQDKSSEEKVLRQKQLDENKTRILKITRTHRDEETGKETTNVEIVKEQLIIDAYVKIRTTKDDNFIRQAFALDESEKEQLRKERRRLQEQLRRVKRSEAARQKSDDPNAESKPKKTYKKRQTLDASQQDDLNTSTGPKEPIKSVKCGACGTIGHSRTNRECPMYVPKDKDKLDQHNISSAHDDDSHDPNSQTGFTKIQGTKLFIDKRVMSQKVVNEDSQSNEKLVLTIPKQKLTKTSQQQQPKTVRPLKIPKIKPHVPPADQTQDPQTPTAVTSQLQSQMSRDVTKSQKRKSTSQSLDYLEKPQKKVDRRHVDPLVSLASLLEQVLNELRDLPDSQPFLLPVNAKKVPDYYNVIKNPVDLQTIRKRIHDKYYRNQSTFVDDIKLLVTNSSLYNGNHHIITAQAQNLMSHCMTRINERKEQISRAEKAINPLLDDNTLIAFNYLFERIFDTNVMTVENSYSFQKPVNKTKYKDYYEIIKNPIDLETIKHKISFKKYKSKEQFLGDFELMFNNCLTYNGPSSTYTQTAQKLLDQCKIGIERNFEQLDQFEKLIQEMTSQGIRQSIDGQIASDNESNIITVSSQCDNESRDSHHHLEANTIAPLNLTNKRLTSVFSTALGLRQQSPQSIYVQSDQEFVDIEGIDDMNTHKANLVDDLNISEEDD